LTQNPDLTQLGDDDNSAGMILSPLPPYSPTAERRVPWGRLLSTDGRGPTWDLLPKDPHRDLGETPQGGVDLMGISHVQPSDLFNVYTLGRSTAKADLCIPQPVVDEIMEDGEDNTTDMDAKQQLSNWAFAMISNSHCRIYCTVDNTGTWQAWIEDTSGNGTLVNERTHLRRHEKRLLHTGDEICLVSPTSLRRKVRKQSVLQPLLKRFSFIFMNLRANANQPSSPSVMAVIRRPLSASFSSIRKKAAVNARATAGRPSDASRTTVAASNETTRKSRRLEDDYEVRDLLGQGTAGDVRRAIHRRTGEERAVKIIPIERRQFQRGNATNVQQEALILQSLQHVYVVKLYEVYITDSMVHLVMELLPGGDLFDRILDKGRYTEVESRRVMRRLLSAVYYLHKVRKVVHRDLKPENILLATRESDIDVKLTDFGLAKAINGDGLKTFCGTPQYFAPEVLQRRHTVRGAGRYGEPADMWSLGVILYVLLSGTPPFDPDAGLNSAVDSEGHRVSFPVEHWQGISTAAQNLVTQLLEDDPVQRLTVTQACQHNWILIEDGDTHVDPLEDPVVLSYQKSLGKAENEKESKKEHDICDDNVLAAHSCQQSSVALESGATGQEPPNQEGDSPRGVASAVKASTDKPHIAPHDSDDHTNEVHVTTESAVEPAAASVVESIETAKSSPGSVRQDPKEAAGSEATESNVEPITSEKAEISISSPQHQKTAPVSEESRNRRALSPTSLNTRAEASFLMTRLPKRLKMPATSDGRIDDDEDEIGSFSDKGDESIASFATTEDEVTALMEAAAAEVKRKKAARTEAKGNRKRRRITQSAGDTLGQLEDPKQTTLEGWFQKPPLKK
jgi:serine/threonine protein kinase